MEEDRRWTDEQTIPGSLSDVDADATDDLHRALATEVRRRVLAVLLDNPERTYDVDDLATILAGAEATATGRMATPDDYDRLRVMLHHRDLPMLDAVGLFAYDADESTVTLAVHDGSVVRAIRRLIEPELLADD